MAVSLKHIEVQPALICLAEGPLAALPKEWFGVMPTPDEPTSCFPVLLETLLEVSLER